ncbi:MAG: hypothetical protein K2W96_24240 [Gemmataceae bacterium]|nr:hypothetical protein [Gemmataceae bacterium]
MTITLAAVALFTLAADDAAEKFKKEIGALAAGIGKAKTVVLHEGLPHQTFESELLAKELKAKKTAKVGGFPFYEETVGLKDAEKDGLLELLKAESSYKPFSGEKRCGGFHPDWAVEFKDGDDAYRVLICFGCGEAKILGPKKAELRTDLGEKVGGKLEALLKAKRKNRPEKKK